MRLLRGLNPVPTAEQRTFNKSTNKNIWQVYFPLAISWFFMAWEGQLALWLIGQMPNTKVNQAGFLIIMGIAIFIESPVIDLLSTGTTLGTTKARFHTLTKFTLILMAWVTFAHCAVIFSPAYTYVAEVLLDAPHNVAQSAWYGLAWMPIWSAAVGWRRYRQGIMIRAGKTGPISWGTLIRMSVMFIVGYCLFASKLMTGLGIIGVAFSAAVIAEAIYIHIVSQPVLKKLPHSKLEEEVKSTILPSGEELTEGLSISNLSQVSEGRVQSNTQDLSIPQIFKFHLPLTASTLMMLTTPIFLTRALNEGDQPVIAMAAWQIASTVVWLFRAMTFALPEAVISLYQVGREKLLFRFCSQVGIGLTSIMLLCHFTGFDKFIFTQVYRAEPLVAERAAIAFLWTAFVPALNSWMAYYRGLLTSHHITSARMIAIGVAIVGLLIALTAGLQLNPLSVILAAAALTIAHVVELLTLAIYWKNSAHNTPHKPLPTV
jgi:progressive ankylosis protein